MTLRQAQELDRIMITAARTLLPFGILFGLISAGVSMNNHSRNLYETCKYKTGNADACMLKIYGR